MNIKIAIADDHPLVIGGVEKIIAHFPHITFMGSYCNGTELLEGLKTSVPDILLLDIQMPGKTGEELAPFILKNYPDMKILILTNFDSALYASNMMAHGVHGYILKTADNDTFIKAIETVYNGGQFLEPGMQDKLHHLALRVEKRTFLKSTLTAREREILQLIVDGYTNVVIAERLFLSIKTVDTYRTNIMLKLDVNNTAALVKKAMLLGLVK